MSAVALLVLTGSACDQTSDPKPEAAPWSATASPSPTVSAPPDEELSATAIASAPPPVTVERGYLASLPTGPGPQIPYVVDRVFIDLDGHRTRLPDPPGRSVYISAVEYGKRQILTARTPVSRDRRGARINAVVDRLTRRGHVLEEWSGDAPVTDQSGTAVAWRDADRGLALGDDRTGESTVLVPDPGLTPVAFLDGAVVALDLRDRLRLVTPPVPVTPDRPRAFHRLTRVRAFDDLLGVLFGARRRAPRSERTVAMGLDGDVRWRSDVWTVRGVSPRGSLVHAMSSPTGGDTSSVAILDALTGVEIAEMDVLGVGLGEVGAAFEPDGSLLVRVYFSSRKGLSWTLLRLRQDGSVERATAVLGTGRRYAPPFAFGSSVRS